MLHPISFMFVAAGIARQARMSLIPFFPSRTTNAPSWFGQGLPMATEVAHSPLTPINQWSGRYALTELTLYKSETDKLTINDAVVTISRAKHIVREQLVGLDGTIKEYISNGDFELSITVGIVATDAMGAIVDEYPAEGIARVREFLDDNKSVGIKSVFLSAFDINRIVVSNFSLKQETHSNRQVIEVKAYSDQDYVIKSTEY